MITNPTKKAKSIFSYLTLIYIGIFVSVITFITYLDIKFSNSTPKISPVEVPEIKFLSSDEVSSERNKLLPFSKATTLVQEEKSNEVFYTVLPNDTQIEEKQINVEPPKTYLINNGDLQTEETANTKDFVYVRQNSGISVTTSQTPEDIESKTTSFILEGKIYSKDSKTIVITTQDDTFGKIYITPDTKILINGKNISFDDLKIADIIRAEGTGFVTAKEMQAKNISITGVMQVIPTN